MPHVATAQVVNVPDLNLAALVRGALNLAPNAPITRGNKFPYKFVSYQGIAIENLTNPDRKFEYE